MLPPASKLGTLMESIVLKLETGHYQYNVMPTYLGTLVAMRRKLLGRRYAKEAVGQVLGRHYGSFDGFRAVASRPAYESGQSPRF